VSRKKPGLPKGEEKERRRILFTKNECKEIRKIRNIE